MPGRSGERDGEGEFREERRMLAIRIGAACRRALRRADTSQLFGEPLIVGTPDDAIRMVEDSRRRTRFTHLVMATAHPGADPREVRESLELFAKEVVPHRRG
jgi:alkanesulfonate monooxygenase SsuD/methylene tetrahydromethanopterin reductase-like flavin-dependent oxidoreductase (luciferase family)